MPSRDWSSKKITHNWEEQMSDWIKVSDGLPQDGEMVDEVRLNTGQIVKRVEFIAGRFWKVRQGNGGHAYDAVAWRTRKKRADDGRTESTDE